MNQNVDIVADMYKYNINTLWTLGGQGLQRFAVWSALVCQNPMSIAYSFLVSSIKSQ